MTPDQISVAGLILVMFVLFAWNRWRYDIVAVISLVALVALEWRPCGWMALSASLARLGLGVVFVTGLGWAVWLVERTSRRLLAKRSVSSLRGGSMAVPLLAMNGLPGQMTVHTSNPLDIDAWYYGRKRRKLNQSATTVAAYSLLFALLVLLAGFLTGCNEIYEMPEGLRSIPVQRT